VEIDPKNKAMIDAIVDVRERNVHTALGTFGSSLAWEVSERSTQFGLNSTVRSTGSIRCARGIGLLLFLVFLSTKCSVAISMRSFVVAMVVTPNNAPAHGASEAAFLVASSISSARWARTLGAMDALSRMTHRLRMANLLLEDFCRDLRDGA